jgi:hypothetical protein
MGGSTSKKMKPEDLMNFFIEEAQHRIINTERSKNGDSALAAHGKKGKKGKYGKGQKSKLNVTCDNCGQDGHTKPNCYSKVGGKEGQGPWQKKSKKGEKKTNEVTAVAKTEDQELFAFMCTSDYIAIGDTIGLPKDKLGACLDSGASTHYCPDHTKFQNFQPLEDQNITTTDGCSLKVVSIGDVHIELLNGSK